jgi:hypothetical protein
MVYMTKDKKANTKPKDKNSQKKGTAKLVQSDHS